MRKANRYKRLTPADVVRIIYGRSNQLLDRSVLRMSFVFAADKEDERETESEDGLKDVVFKEPEGGLRA